MIPSAFEALTRGMERERRRLSGSAFLALAFRQEFDYDGLTCYLELLQGFRDEAAAIHAVEEAAGQALSRALTAPSYSPHRPWRRDPARNNQRFVEKHESPLVRGVHLRSFRVLNDSGFDSIYFQFEVLRVDDPSAIGPDLLSYFDAESEWVDYFISKGQD